MAANYWAKIWIDILEEAKVASLPESSWRRFVECILLAKQENEGGFLPDTFQMAFSLRINEQSLKDDMTRLALAGLVELRDTPQGERWFIPKFEDRQAQKITDADKAKRWRDKQERAVTNGLPSVTGGNPEAETEADSRNRKQIAETEAEADKNAAAAAAVNPRLQAIGLGTNARTLALLELPNFDAEYAAEMVAWAERNGRDLGLAIKKIEDGDPVPGQRERQIPAELADVITR
jgi:hypothetical protein